MQSTFQKVKNKLNQILALFGNGYSVYRAPQCCIWHLGADGLSSTTKTGINFRSFSRKKKKMILCYDEKQNQRNVSVIEQFQCFIISFLLVNIS